MMRSVHLDEEIHENADPRRYMEQKRFSKNGKTFTNHSMPWVGGGVSMCEGRSVDSSSRFRWRFGWLSSLSLGILKTRNSEDSRRFFSCDTPEVRGVSDVQKKLGRIGAGVMHPKGDPKSSSAHASDRMTTYATFSCGYAIIEHVLFISVRTILGTQPDPSLPSDAGHTRHVAR